METSEAKTDTANTRRLSHEKARLRCYSGRQWQEDTLTASAAARPHCPECSLLPLLLPLSSFSLCCISAGPHRSTALSPFSSPHRVCFLRLPCFRHTPSPTPPPQPPSGLPLLLTRSSDCTEPHLHSSGGSLSCMRACPGSCCGCCALYSHWAPFRIGKVARTRWASGTVVEDRVVERSTKEKRSLARARQPAASNSF